MSSKGQDTLRAIHGRDGAKISMNWTNKGSSAFATPLCKDEGGGGGVLRGIWGAMPTKVKGGGSADVYVQKRRNTKRGMTRDQDCLMVCWELC